MAQETILIIEDEEYLAKSIRDLLEPSGYEIHIAQDRKEGREKINELKPDLLLLDLALPPSYTVAEGIEFFKECLSSKQCPKIVVMTGQGKVDDAIECIRFGAEDFLLKPVNPDVLTIVVERALYKLLLEKKVDELEAESDDSFGMAGIVGTSKVMKKVFKGILYAASIDENVLITGETGVGKGVVAKAIHQRSDRRDSPFVHVNCAALSRTIIESELFGHEKGSFTGAKDFKLGKFEYAEQGTVFLDEVAEIPVDLQIKLLHAVEEKTIQRVGGNTNIQIGARIIAAANRDLSEAVGDGSFRKDLFYRLNILPIRIPPLRERKEDIPVLVSFFLDKYRRKHGKPPVSLRPSALARLEQHDWPGNVRELENVLARAVISTNEKVLSSDDLTLSLRGHREHEEARHGMLDDGEEDIVDAVEEELASEYRTALLKAKGNKSMAAKLLGVPESTFRYRLKKYRRFLRGV